MPTRELGAATLGVWTRRAALAVVTRGHVQRRLASGAWQQVLPGVYADGGYLLSPEQSALAAVMATGDAVSSRVPGDHVPAIACGRTAARVHVLPLIDDDDPSTGACEKLIDDVHTFRARGGRSLALTTGDRRLVRHRLTLLDDELVRHPSGLVLTSALRTAVDCTRLLSHEAAVCVIDAGLRQCLFTATELEHASDAREGWPAVARLRAAIHAGDGRAESPGESLARLLLRPALPGLVPQVRVRDERGRIVARLDLGDEQVRLGVEVDGKRGHAGSHMVAKDRRRDRLTEALGWYVERITWHELRTQPADVLARVVTRHSHLAR
jgi:hypothetical protein